MEKRSKPSKISKVFKIRGNVVISGELFDDLLLCTFLAIQNVHVKKSLQQD